MIAAVGHARIRKMMGKMNEFSDQTCRPAGENVGMATKIKGFLAGTSYAPYVSTAEALLRKGCEAIHHARVSSALVVLEDGTIWVGHPVIVWTR